VQVAIPIIFGPELLVSKLRSSRPSSQAYARVCCVPSLAWWTLDFRNSFEGLSRVDPITNLRQRWRRFPSTIIFS